MPVFEVVALVFLILEPPVKTVLASLVGNAVELLAEAAVSRLNRRLRVLRLLRDDIDDAALGIRAVKRRCRTAQHLDAIDTAEIFHRRCQRCRRTTCIILLHTINENNNILRAIDIELCAVIIPCRRILIDRNARDITQSLRQIRIMALFEILSRDDRDICIRLELLYRRTRRRDDRLVERMLRYGILRRLRFCGKHLPPRRIQSSKRKCRRHRRAEFLPRPCSSHFNLLLKFCPQTNLYSAAALALSTDKYRE